MPDQQTPTDAGDATGGAPSGGTFTQEQLDKAVQARLAREKAAHEKQLAELQAKLTELTTAEDQRKLAELSELEKAQKALADAQAQAAQARADADAARQTALRSSIIAAEAADLPPLVRSQITGTDEETVRASIADLRKQWDELKTQVTGQAPRSVGSPSAAPGGQPPVPPGAGPPPNTQLSPLEQLLAAAQAADAAEKG
jgi:hypothetical protein